MAGKKRNKKNKAKAGAVKAVKKKAAAKKPARAKLAARPKRAKPAKKAAPARKAVARRAVAPKKVVAPAKARPAPPPKPAPAPPPPPAPVAKAAPAAPAKKGRGKKAAPAAPVFNPLAELRGEHEALHKRIEKFRASLEPQPKGADSEAKLAWVTKVTEQLERLQDLLKYHFGNEQMLRARDHLIERSAEAPTLLARMERDNDQIMTAINLVRTDMHQAVGWEEPLPQSLSKDLLAALKRVDDHGANATAIYTELYGG